MFLGKLFNSVKREYQKIPVNGISFDSRNVKKNYIFFAISGTNISGDQFIEEAISKGASAIVYNGKKKT